MNALQRLYEQARQAGRPIDPGTGLPFVSSTELAAMQLTQNVVPWTFGGRGYLPEERNTYTGAPFYGFGVGGPAVPDDVIAKGIAAWQSGLWRSMAVYAVLFGALAYFFRGKTSNLVGRPLEKWQAGLAGAAGGAVLAGLQYATFSSMYNLPNIAAGTMAEQNQNAAGAFSGTPAQMSPAQQAARQPATQQTPAPSPAPGTQNGWNNWR